jgi:hypothetical protein
VLEDIQKGDVDIDQIVASRDATRRVVEHYATVMAPFGFIRTGNNPSVGPSLIIYTSMGAAWSGAAACRAVAAPQADPLEGSGWEGHERHGANWINNCMPDCRESTPHPVKLHAFRPRVR